MTYHNVECERVEPASPERYVCRWKDRNTLACGLLTEGKGAIISEQPGIKGAKGITQFSHAIITIDHYAPK